jgi:hypothetical protein
VDGSSFLRLTLGGEAFYGYCYAPDKKAWYDAPGEDNKENVQAKENVSSCAHSQFSQPEALAVEVSLHICYQGAHGYHGVAQASFRATESTAPVVDFVNGFDIDARSIGRNEWGHGAEY